MFDLDKIVDDVQPTDELEDVVMGVDYQRRASPEFGL